MMDAEVRRLGPEFKKDWEQDFAPYPSKPVMLFCVVNTFLADQSLVEPGQYFTAAVYTAYPYSRGSIHITSADNIMDGYVFDAGFLKHPSDVKKQIWAYKASREVMRRLPYYKGELELGHPKFAPGSKATLVDFSKNEAPFHLGDDHKLQNIEYSQEDDDAIEAWIRGNLNTTWHSVGTCAMKPKAVGGVVDADLNVYGTAGLKVADLSILPENVGANTNNTALVVGEKAAVIIGKELGLEV
jgi:alcohol oxidase